MAAPEDSRCLTCFRGTESGYFVDIQNEENKVVPEALSKHFWFTVEDFDGAILCQPCWDQLDSFHRFYGSVEELYRVQQLNSVDVKLEVEICQAEVEVEEADKEQLLPDAFETVLSPERNESELEIGEPSDYDEPSEEEEEPPEEEKEEVKPLRGKRASTLRAVQSKPKKRTYTKSVPKTAEERQEEDEIIRKHVNCTCEQCGLTSETFTGYLRHALEAHGNRSAFLSCCGRRFYKKIRLYHHVQTFNDPETFRCYECKRNFTNEEGIRRHLKEYHAPEEERKYRCERCAKSFVSEYKYRKHMNDHEDHDNKNCQCEHCGKHYKSRHILANHIKLKHTEPTDFICDICAKGFHLESQFLIHKKEHLNPAELKMQCEICLQWLKNRPNWRRHMQSHVQPEVSCDICGHVSPHPRALMGHKRRQHGSNNLHSCSYCPKTFRKPISLKEHVAAVHIGVVLYTCPFCDKTFNSHANMHSHKRKMHTTEWLQERNQKLLRGRD